MNMVTKSPYYKSTWISLLFHGALVCFLTVLVPFGPRELPPEIIPVEIVPAKVLDAAMPAESAAPAPSPSSSPEPQETQTGSFPSRALEQSLPNVNPEPRAVQLPSRDVAVERETLPPALPGESSETSVALPVSAGTGTAVVHFGGTGAALSAPGGGNGNQPGGQEGQGGGGGGSSGPSCTYGPKPVYPPGARKAGEEGTALVELSIDETGAVVSVTLGASSGYADLDAAALRGLQQWRFSPALKDGVPVASSHNVRVKFSLTDEECY